MVSISSERRAFGDRLKRQRERRGITLDAISRSTKVSAPLFEGLERGDCSRWPAGLYARAYVRAYADIVGLNADEAVEDFSAAFASSLDGDGQTPVRAGHRAPLRLSMDPPPVSPQRVLKRVGLTAADLVIGFLIAWVAHVGLGLGVWSTVGCALAYHALGRAISDEPLLYWLYLRMRPAAPVAPDTSEVAVGDTASTTA